MTSPKRSATRPKGSIDVLPSGARRVRVYAGVDPLTRRKHYLQETIPPSTPRIQAEAEKVLRRLAGQVDQGRQPRSGATLNELLDMHFELLPSEIGEKTFAGYSGYLKRHIRPLLGRHKIGSFDARLLDSFYAELARCREHCSGKRAVNHRAPSSHDCDHRCRPHECTPLAPATIRQIHFILSGAFARAVRWQWMSVNPMENARDRRGRRGLPTAPTPDPTPPSPQEAAAIINHAFRDPAWGTLVWLSMMTGARRGEICALKWSDVDLNTGTLKISRSIGQIRGKTWEKDTKTHQQRRIALDEVTVSVLKDHLARATFMAQELSVTITAQSRIFSRDIDGTRWLLPDGVSQRYSKLVKRLGIATSLKNLRHYSATELISAGVDIRTVAGRLGHGSGGVTTLRVYAAWVNESDQRASKALAQRVPQRPTIYTAQERARLDPRSPYESVAAELRGRIERGGLKPGAHVPTLVQLSEEFGVAVGTAQRAVALLAAENLVRVERGSRTIVCQPLPIPTVDQPPTP